MDSSIKLLSESNFSAPLAAGPGLDSSVEQLPQATTSALRIPSAPTLAFQANNAGPDPDSELMDPMTAFVPTIEVKLDASPAPKPKKSAQAALPIAENFPPTLPESNRVEAPIHKIKRSSKKSKHRGSLRQGYPLQPMVYPDGGDRLQFTGQPSMPMNPYTADDTTAFGSYDPVPLPPQPGLQAPQQSQPQQQQQAPRFPDLAINQPPILLPDQPFRHHMSFTQAAQFFPWTYASESEQRYHEELFRNSLLLESLVTYISHIALGLLGGASLLSMLVLPVSVPGSEMIGVFLGFYSRFSLHASRLLNFLSTVSLVSVLNSVIGPYPWTRPKNWDVQPGGHGQTEQRQGRVNTGEMQIQDGLLGHQLNASGHKSSLRVVVQGLMCISGATCFLASIFSTPIDDSLYFSELGGGTGRYGSSGWYSTLPLSSTATNDVQSWTALNTVRGVSGVLVLLLDVLDLRLLAREAGDTGQRVIPAKRII